MTSQSIIIAVGVAVLIIGYTWYVILVGRRNRAKEALASVDVHLRKRHDLLPNVLAMVKKFMDHERDLMDRLTELRSRLPDRLETTDTTTLQTQLRHESEFAGLLGQLFAVAENYPDLRSSENMLAAQRTFEDVEGHIAAARRFYNSAVTDLNNSAQIWPGSMIARITGIAAMPFFEETDPTVRAPVDAAALLK